MSSLTTYGQSRAPFNGTIGSILTQVFPNYGTLVGGSVGNSASSTWGYLHLWDASSPNQVVPGQTPPKMVIPVEGGTTVPLTLGPGAVFNQGVVAGAFTAVNGNVGVGTQLAVSLVFNNQPTD
jgi:hypothetical protein